MAKTYTKAVLVTRSTHEDLECLKRIPQEPFGAVVERLIKFYQTYNEVPRELEQINFVE